MAHTLSDIFEGNYGITQYFGERPWAYAPTFPGHEGVDFGTPNGVYVLCPFNSGIVLRTGWDYYYGYYIVIWDKVQKCAVWHCHLSQISVYPGQVLSRGQRAGKTGSTGNVTGPHLHEGFVETDQYGNRINTNNGYQGYRNILNSYLVQWLLYKLGMTKAAPHKFKKVKSPNVHAKLSIDEVMAKDLKLSKSVFKTVK